MICFVMAANPKFIPFLQVAKARETEEKIDVELKELQATLANIEQVRPFDQLTVCLVSFWCIN